MSKCKNKIEIGQSGSMTCGDKWGDTPVICDVCKAINKMKCNNCKYFIADAHTELGTCDKFSMTEDESLSAIPLGEEHDIGFLLTKPDFGCIEFEVKDE
jgi:hypothetical protein